MGINCDNQRKILIPDAPDRTIATITGTGTILAAPAQPVPLAKICEHVRTGRRLLDIDKAVLEFVQLASTPVSALDISALAARCLDEVNRAHRNGAPLEEWRNSEMFVVVLAAYDPIRSEFLTRGFKVRVSEALSPEATGHFTDTRTKTSRQDYWLFGEADYFNAHVVGGAGRLLLGPAVTRLLTTNQSIQALGPDDAESVAVELITAAALTTNVVRARSGIGGPVDVVLLGTEARPIRKRWKPD